MTVPLPCDAASPAFLKRRWPPGADWRWPAPLYRKALWYLDLPPDRAVAFEDPANGLHAAVAAGLWTVVTPTFWTEGSDFKAASLLLPHFGDDAHPLPGEPGTHLQSAPWLTIDELLRQATSPRTSRPWLQTP